MCVCIHTSISIRTAQVPPAAGLRQLARPAAVPGPRCPQSPTSGHRSPRGSCGTDHGADTRAEPARTPLVPLTAGCPQKPLAPTASPCSWLMGLIFANDHTHTGKEPEEQMDRQWWAGPDQAGVLTSQPLTQDRLFYPLTALFSHTCSFPSH